MNYTHKIIFKDRGLGSINVTGEQAEIAQGAKKVGSDSTIDLNGSVYEAGSIKAVIKLDAPIAKRNIRECTNIKCHRESRQHYEEDHCEYDKVQCHLCDKEMNWRDWDYINLKYNRGKHGGRFYCLKHIREIFFADAEKGDKAMKATYGIDASSVDLSNRQNVVESI